MKVRVSFTDDDGNSETLTSAAVYVSGPFSAQFLGVPASHDGETAFTFELRFSQEPTLEFEKVRDDVLTVTKGDVTSVRRTNPQSDTPNIRWEITVQPDDDSYVTVVLPPTTDCSADSAVCTSGGTMLSNRSSITVRGPTPINTAATGQPIIIGITTVGSTLTANTSSISDANGIVNTTFTYQWLHSDTAISGATGSIYTVASADEGSAIKVRVTFTDDDGFSESLTSAGLDIPVVPLGRVLRRLHRAGQPRRGQHHVHVPVVFQRGTHPEFRGRTRRRADAHERQRHRRAPDAPAEQHAQQPVGDHRAAQRGRRGDHLPQSHHRLHGGQRRLHQIRQEAVQQSQHNRGRAIGAAMRPCYNSRSGCHNDYARPSGSVGGGPKALAVVLAKSPGYEQFFDALDIALVPGRIRQLKRKGPHTWTRGPAGDSHVESVTLLKGIEERMDRLGTRMEDQRHAVVREPGNLVSSGSPN